MLFLQGTDDDLDAVLAGFKLADAAVSAVRVEEDCPPPSARVCGSFTPLPLRVRCCFCLKSPVHCNADDPGHATSESCPLCLAVQDKGSLGVCYAFAL